MTVYEVLNVSHCGQGEYSVGLYVHKDDAAQKMTELLIISYDDPCNEDYSIQVRERNVVE